MSRPEVDVFPLHHTHIRGCLSDPVLGLKLTLICCNTHGYFEDHILSSYSKIQFNIWTRVLDQTDIFPFFFLAFSNKVKLLFQ